MILPREVQKALLKHVFCAGAFPFDTALCHPTIRWGSVCFFWAIPTVSPLARLHRGLFYAASPCGEAPDLACLSAGR